MKQGTQALPTVLGVNSPIFQVYVMGGFPSEARHFVWTICMSCEHLLMVGLVLANAQIILNAKTGGLGQSNFPLKFLSIGQKAHHSRARIAVSTHGSFDPRKGSKFAERRLGRRVPGLSPMSSFPQIPYARCLLC